jgi:hypothetical protein
MTGPSLEPGPTNNTGPVLSLDYNTTNALALLVAAPRGSERLIEVKQFAHWRHGAQTGRAR